uniref:Astacin domain-containing protein n=1 Tax=Parastrongyloides trichosuri TaxID=131310 RepID=A0A0N4ZI40_PARTI
MNFLWGNITHTYKKTFDVSNDINEPSIKGKYGIKLAPNTDSIDIKKRSNDKDYDSDTKLRISKIMEDLNSLNLFTLLEGKYYDSVENDSLGFTDFKLINAYYCHKICKTKLECKNSGYADPRDCSKCKCPTFYEGTYCEDLKKFNENCTAPHTLNITNDTFIKLDDQGKKTCYTSIKAPEGKTVEIVLKQVSFKTLNEDENIRCLSNQSLEVRYYKDKGPMGALFCRTLSDRYFNSHGNIVDVRFSGAYSADTYSMEVRVSNKTYEKTVCDKQGFIKI